MTRVPHARFVGLSVAVLAVVVLLGSQLVGTGHGQTLKLPPPLPVPRHQPVWHPFPGYAHPYRGACATWTRKPECLLVDSRAAA